MTTTELEERPSSPLAMTAGNVAVGAGWTMTIFVTAMSVVGGLLGGVFGFAIALFVAGFATLVATPLLGVPLSLLAARILRHTPARWPHLLGQFVAGAAGASIAMGAYLALTDYYDSLSLGSFWAFIFAACAAIAGLSSTAGWALALRHSRREPKPDRFDAYSEDVD